MQHSGHANVLAKRVLTRKFLSNRGNAYARHGILPQAISDYNKAIEINPKDALAYYNRGAAYAKQGNLLQAISDYNKAVEINPNFANAYYNRGVAYCQSKRMKKLWQICIKQKG